MVTAGLVFTVACSSLSLPPTEVCQERVGSLLSELIYALVGKTVPMAAKCPLMSQRENISHTA